jgi:hypothetical protein
MAKRDANSRPSLVRQLFSLAAALLLRPAGRRPHEENPGVRYESSDIDIRGVLLTGAGIALVTAFCAGVMYFPFEHFKHVREQAAAIEAAGATARVQLPPEPRLQRSPSSDWREYSKAQQAELNRYAWVDRQKGVVAIPIDRAIELVAQRGLPPQKTPPKLFYTPQAGSRLTGLEGLVEPEPR